MTKVKVRVLYPTAFADQVEAGDEVEVDEALATSLIGEGFAEVVSRQRGAKQTETAVVKLKSE
jgi:hypothetical protein